MNRQHQVFGQMMRLSRDYLLSGGATNLAIGPPRLLAQAGSLQVTLAQSPEELRQALVLRYKIFVQELAGLSEPDFAREERDRFDRFCLHLIARDTDSGQVVGTYRILLPEMAELAGGYYIENEFDIGRLEPLRPYLIELGRACVDPEYRGGAVMLLLWTALGNLLASRRDSYLIGCASVSLSDAGVAAASLYRRISDQNLVDDTLRVHPREPLPLDALPDDPHARMPALLKGYLRAGALLMGRPHVDNTLACVDLPLILPLERLDARYQRRFAPTSLDLPVASTN